ncbi:hypothetical protein D3C78_1438690 [compost metagenome]
MPVGDDVVRRESLGLVQLVRLQHAQADVDDQVRVSADPDGDQCKTVAGGDGVEWLLDFSGVAVPVIVHQESGAAQGAGLDLR